VSGWYRFALAIAEYGVGMGSPAENLFGEGGDAGLLDLLPPVEAFMDDPGRASALRLVLLGLSDATPKTEVSFTALFKEWNRFQNVIGKKGDRATKERFSKGFGINEHTIKRFVFLTHKPDRRIAGLLSLLATHVIEQDGRIGHRPIKSAIDGADFVSPIKTFLSTRDPASLSQPQTEADPRAQLNSALRTLLKIDHPDDQKNIARWLFKETDIRKLLSKPEKSYYAVYRYSTQIPEIVKTLVVIASPAPGGSDCFSFVHFYISKRNNVRRTTKGTLIGFSESIYFVGMSASVLTDPLGRTNIDYPQGLKVIVIPRSEPQTSDDLLAGVYMSNGLNWSPIVGRIALVHIGFESVIGPLSDARDEVRPAILRGPDALEDDLRKLCTIPKSRLAGSDVADLTQKTLIRINNRPHCDRHRSEIAVEGVIRALQPEDEQTPRP
jgi:hypothetical protein